MSGKTLEFRLALDLAPHLDGKAVVTYGVCCDGTLAVLVTDPSARELPFGRIVRAGGSFCRTVAEEEYPITFVRFGSDLIQKIELPPSKSTFPQLQIFPDNSILIVTPRCRFTNTGAEQNACLYSEQGELLRRFCLGDGINDVRISDKGEIWVSYFDEGVFGNYGWSEPLGQPGICCFDSHGNKTWSFAPPAGFDIICDCYAMNVGAQEVWACYYSEFPLVRIGKDKRVKGWKNELRGATAIACNGYHVLLYGGYKGERSRCVVQTIERDNTLHHPTTYQLDLPASADGVSVIGRDSELHTLVNQSWYRFSLDDL